MLRRRLKDQLFRIDATYPDVDFFYTGSDGEKRRVQTVEEQEFPQFYYLKPALDPKQQDQSTDAVEDDVIESQFSLCPDALNGDLPDPVRSDPADV